MAWSDNVRCLHCDGKLPLYRKITSGQFCSAVHRKAYWQEQERLAVERLHQTHDSLRAYRPGEGLEAILGKPAGEPVGPDRYYLAEREAAEVRPTPEVEQIARSAANTGNVSFAGFLTEEKPALRAWNELLANWDIAFAQWPMSTPSMPTSAVDEAEAAWGAAGGVALPLFHAIGLAAKIRAEADNIAAVDFTAKLNTDVPLALALETEELTLGFLEAHKAAEKVIAAAPVEEAPYPFAETLFALPKIAAQAASRLLRMSGPEPLETASRAQNARFDTAYAIPAIAPVAQMQPLALTNTPKANAASAGVGGDVRIGDLQGYAQPKALEESTRAPWMNLAIPAAAPEMALASGSRYAIFGRAGDAIGRTNVEGFEANQVLDLSRETDSPSKTLTTHSFELSLNTAPGCRYGIQNQTGTMQPVADPQPLGVTSVPSPQAQLATQPPAMSLNLAPCCELAVQSQPGHIRPLDAPQALASTGEIQIVPLPESLGQGERHPAIGKIRPLAFAATPYPAPAAVPMATGVTLLYPANAPMNPVAKQEPINGADTPPLRQGFLAGWTHTLANSGERKHVWAHAADFWQHAPRDLKLLAIAIPILLGLALRPSLPRVRVAAPGPTGGISKNIESGFRQQFVNVRNTVAERAGVSLSEDFRSGLDEWQTRGDLSSGWSFDGNGFVKPGTLALYRPSLGLSDYDMDFLGMIDKKALSWVVRAKDFDNYYVVKLVVLKAGPLPTMGITRYAVIDGKAQNRVDSVAAINARPDELYRVTMNVHEDTFLLTLQGNVVDSWTDTRLKRGGVGFFAPKGEESRLRWLQITHQYDMLGRLCAYLAPYNIPTTNGSW